MPNVAIVTGGGRGLGRNTVLSLAQRDVDSIFTYHANPAEAEQVVGLVAAARRKAVALQLDTGDVGAFDAFVDRVRQALGRAGGRALRLPGSAPRGLLPGARGAAGPEVRGRGRPVNCRDRRAAAGGVEPAGGRRNAVSGRGRFQLADRGDRRAREELLAPARRGASGAVGTAISLLPYPERLPAGRHQLSMAIGGERRVTAIDASHWRILAADLHIPADALLARVAAMAEQLPDALDRVVAAASHRSTQDTLDRLAAPMRAHAGECLRRVSG